MCLYLCDLESVSLVAFQKKVFWLNCQSLGFIQEHKMSCPVLDMMSDQLERDSFYNAVPLLTFCCSAGHHSELVMQF